MPHDVISTCPVCSSELAVTRLHCRSCGTTLEGDFSVGRFGRLNRDQLTLLESFLRSRGNLREMERELGISYPTVRSRVEALVRTLGFGPRSDADDADEATPEPVAPPPQPSGHPRGAGPPRDERRGRRRGDPGAREDRAMTMATGSALEHAIGADGLLAIHMRDGEIQFRGVEGDTVRVRDRNDHDLADMFSIEAGLGSLSLKAGRGLEIIVGRTSLRRGQGGHTPELEVDLPRGASLVFEAGSTDIEADGLIGDQRYRTASGDVDLRAVGGALSVDAVSGDIRITAVETATIAARSVSGDVAIRAATLSALQVTTTSGDVGVAGRLAGQGPYAIETVSGDGLLEPSGDIEVEMSSVTGDLSSDLDARPVSGHGRRTLVVGSGGPILTFRSMSGDLHVGRRAAVDPVPAAERPTSDRAPNAAIAQAYEEARLQILRSLERGEIDVREAGRRLEQLDSGDVPPSSPAEGDPAGEGDSSG